MIHLILTQQQISNWLCLFCSDTMKGGNIGYVSFERFCPECGFHIWGFKPRTLSQDKRTTNMVVNGLSINSSYFDLTSLPDVYLKEEENLTAELIEDVRKLYLLR
mgnify:CR=1 FL=1